MKQTIILISILFSLTLSGQKAPYDTIKDNHYVWIDKINLKETQLNRDLTDAEVDLLNDSIPPHLVYKNHCIHEFIEGPYYITVTVSSEEPDYYSPSGIMKIEYCKKCGVLKLPDSFIGYTGKNLHEGKNFNHQNQER